MTHTRGGFFARVRLEPFGQGKIYPHEQTLSGPKADRLGLYQATGLNLSPIFGPIPTRRRGATRRPRGPGDSRPVAYRTPGVTGSGSSRTNTQPRIRGLMAAKPVFIATATIATRPGSHTATNGQAGELGRRRRPAEFCLMMFVGISDPGLLILRPTGWSRASPD